MSELEARLAVLNPHLHEGVPLLESARRAGVPRRTATRWLAAYQANGLEGLRRLERADRGGRRLPQEVVQPIEGMALRRPPPKIAEVHRAVNRIAVDRSWPPVSYPWCDGSLPAWTGACSHWRTQARMSTGMISNWSCVEKQRVPTIFGRPITPSST